MINSHFHGNDKFMVILGVDPGTAIIGYGFIQTADSQIKIINYGYISTSPSSTTANRLKTVYQQLNKLIKKYSPEIMAVEDLFFFKNLKTAIKVSQARGVILLAGADNNLSIAEYTPLQVKQAVTGYGRAEKSQIQKMIKMIFKLKEIPKPDDIADALAIAFCCASSYKLSQIKN